MGKLIEDTLRLLCEADASVVEGVPRGPRALGNEYPARLSSEAMGVLKGRRAIRLFRSYPGLKRRPYWGTDLLAGQFAIEYGDPLRVLDEVRHLLRADADAAFVLNLQKSEVVPTGAVELAQLGAPRPLLVI